MRREVSTHRWGLSRAGFLPWVTIPDSDPWGKVSTPGLHGITGVSRKEAALSAILLCHLLPMRHKFPHLQSGKDAYPIRGSEFSKRKFPVRARAFIKAVSKCYFYKPKMEGLLERI